MTEIWKDIQGYEGFYQISNLGNVKSLERVIDKGNGILQHRKERIMNKRESVDGYYVAKLNVNKKSKSIAIHILVARHFIDNPNNYPEVNHKDCNRANPRYDNLEWISHIDNIRYSSNKGHYKSSKEGLKNGRCTYTKEQVIKIRELYKIGYSIMDIIKQIFPDYDYKQRKLKWNTVKDICTYKSFKNI